MKRIFLMLSVAFAVLLANPTRAQIPDGYDQPRINVITLAERRISGMSVRLGVGLTNNYCLDMQTLQVKNRVEVVPQQGRLTVRIYGYCPPSVIFLSLSRGVGFDIGSIPPGTYQIFFEHYEFDGRLVASGPAVSSSTNPFTMLPATDENLRVFAVPATSRGALGGLVAATTLIACAYLKRRRWAQQ
jgi:hypothetical protein